jgi:hypothetical protein
MSTPATPQPAALVAPVVVVSPDAVAAELDPATTPTNNMTVMMISNTMIIAQINCKTPQPVNIF